MKKGLKALFVLSLLFIMVSCKSEVINLKELQYYDYLSDDNPLVIIKVKDFGELHLELFPSVAENTVNNFLSYALDKKFDGSSFHRIIKGFMIQGGQVSQTNRPIKGEFSSNGFPNYLKHDRGVISMARTNVVNSATSQFFVMHEVSPHLDGQYAAFGGLVKGFDVLDKIANVKTAGMYDAPVEKVVIESVTVKLNGYEVKEVVYI